MDDLLREFVTETYESLDIVDAELVRFEQDPNNARILANIFRLVHTIKGTCGFLGLPRLEALAHAAETLMGKFRDGLPVTGAAVTLVLSTIDRIKALLDALERDQHEPAGEDSDLIAALEQMVVTGGAIVSAPKAPDPVSVAPREARDQPSRRRRDSSGRAERTLDEASAETVPADDRPGSKVANASIRVNVDTLEQLMTLVSELVLTRNQLIEIVRRHADSEFKVPLQRLSNVTAELQEGVMKTRMQPIGNAWQKLPRIVRDLATELGKEIELEMHGGDTELDRQVLDIIKDPLAHMVRNSADHGIEPPQERRALGKSEKGTIRLSAYHEGGHIIIEIADDGRGLDTGRIKAKAVASGLVGEAEAEKMSEAQIHKLIFAAGFSTAAQVTSISGRGVGMDIVLNNIDLIGGTIDVKSVPGRGSSFIIKIPLTLAIVSALIVDAAGHRFAIPQLAVIELVRAQSNSEHRIERIKDTPVLRLRNKLLPLTHLRKLLKIGDSGDDSENGFVVVAQVGRETFGIVVDGVFHTEEIVVKPMSSKLRHIAMFLGTTILGDGSVIMILDPNGIARAVGTAGAQTVKAADADASAHGANDNDISLLIFRAGSAQPKAVPLSLVTRLEEVDAATIEVSSGRHMVQYRGYLMPLVPIHPDAPVRREGTQPLLVFSDEGRAMGLVVDQIVDIVEDVLDIEVASEKPGVLGSAVVKGQATEIIDVGHYLPLAFEDRLWRKGRQADAKTRTLLFVDDSDFFRNMLTPVLKAAGYNVTAVARAEDALARLREGGGIDVVVTDIEMPGMSGYELAKAVRTDPRTAAVPIIALSSITTAEALERGREAGFHEYVAKFDRPGLIAALKEHVAAAMENAA